MAAAKAFLLMFLLLVSLALIPYEAAAARDLLEVKDKKPGDGALNPNKPAVPAGPPGKPYTPGCRGAYCRGRNPGPPGGP